MTSLLQKAFEKASSLPLNLQDMLAKEMLDEIAWEEKWDDSLEKSKSEIDELARKAMLKYKAGKTVAKGFDEL